MNPCDETALKWEPGPQQPFRKMVSVQRHIIDKHVDVCRKDRNQNGDQPPARPSSCSQEKDPDSTDHLRQAAEPNQNPWPRQTVRNQWHVNVRCDEVIQACADEEHTEDDP